MRGERKAKALGLKREMKALATGMRDETSVIERREEGPESGRRDDISESEISCDKSDDADFNSKESVTIEEQQALALKHSEEWMSVLQRDVLMSSSLPLHQFLLTL